MNSPENNDSAPVESSEEPVVPQMMTGVVNDALSNKASVPQSPPSRRLTIGGVIAWLVVLLITSGIFYQVVTTQLFTEVEVGGDATSMDLMPMQLQGKVLVGQKEIAGQTQMPQELDAGPYEQRLCYTVLLNELESSTEALEHLRETDEKVENANLELTDDQERLRGVILELFEGYDAGNPDSSAIPSSDREFLKSKLEWIGELALYPVDTPHTVERSSIISGANDLMTGGIVFMLAAFFLGFTGVVMALVLGVMMFTGKISSCFKNQPTDHNVYIETFAVWIAVFFGSSIALSLLTIESGALKMMIQLLIFFGSLAALIWPVLRGVSFSQVRYDIGWTFKNPIKEVACAIWVYLATLPFLLPGAILIVIIMAIVGGLSEPHEFARQSTPGHPIQEDIMSGDYLVIGFVFFATCVAAPIVEETMFRGVLYRHLRDWTGNWNFIFSVCFAALLNGIIFASIHPQGIFGIPVLTTLAIGFTVARQWRDSLLSSMAMHAMHNFLVTCVSVLIL